MELQLLATTRSLKRTEIPPASAAWSLNFSPQHERKPASGPDVTCAVGKSEKLKLHAAEAGGICEYSYQVVART
ncbi:MAG: hypothetical protein C5B55_14480 [Blastocatellia bacterium]|nr:MAG: hypothetical protein C5B55_14480 [Blastocatellia bacterium]